jgi:hypothetical protein
MGVTSEYKRFNGLGLADVLTSGRTGLVGSSGPAVGPVEYVNVALDGDRVMTCVQFGLLLVRDGGTPLAVLVAGSVERSIRDHGQVEVMAPDRDLARRFLAELRAGMHERNVYRGHVVSLTMDAYGPLRVQFHALPAIGRDDIVLADGVLERVERHTVGFSAHRDRLLAAGRHLRRGLLLHGRPGTGKTLTAMYLAGRMRERTVVLLSGREVGLIPRACGMARLLQPSMVILEDVDLVAEERDRQQPGCTPLLFELLNEMDGLGDDADVIFLLTAPTCWSPPWPPGPAGSTWRWRRPCRTRAAAAACWSCTATASPCACRPTAWTGWWTGPRAPAPPSSASCCARPRCWPSSRPAAPPPGTGSWWRSSTWTAPSTSWSSTAAS